MKKVLFIMPDLSTGGTTSSFYCLYNYLKRNTDLSINVYPISNFNGDIIVDKKDMVRNSKLLSAYYCRFKEVDGFLGKMIVSAVKIIKRICYISKIDLKKILWKNELSILNTKKWDVVIGFQEGYANEFASLVKSNKKLAWIHCNYKYHNTEGRDDFPLYNKFDKIISVSKYTSNVFSEFYPKLKEKSTYLYNLIDVRRILELSNKEVSDYKKDCFTIISCGRIAQVKQFSIIPKIAAEIVKQEIKFKWIIVGPPHDENEYKSLVSNIITYKLNDIVILLGEKNNPYPYFKLSDLYVCTSLSEACPMVFRESQILNLPVVTTDFPSSYEFIQDRRNGRIINIDNMSEVISELICNKYDYNSIKGNCIYSEADEKMHRDRVYDIIKQ